MSQLDAVLARIDTDLDASLERLFAFLRIPSISTDSAYAAECRRAAEWVAADLKTLGFADAAPRPTPGHPVVVQQSLARIFFGGGGAGLRPVLGHRAIDDHV